jgi:hypothetical protein
MWNEPYLESCCRSALHRLHLSGKAGRPAASKDGPCLERLVGLGLAAPRDDERYEVTRAGIESHSQEIKRRQTCLPIKPGELSPRQFRK